MRAQRQEVISGGSTRLQGCAFPHRDHPATTACALRVRPRSGHSAGRSAVLHMVKHPNAPRAPQYPQPAAQATHCTSEPTCGGSLQAAEVCRAQSARGWRETRRPAGTAWQHACSSSFWGADGSTAAQGGPAGGANAKPPDAAGRPSRAAGSAACPAGLSRLPAGDSISNGRPRPPLTIATGE
jgi:hypothetical protein